MCIEVYLDRIRRLFDGNNEVTLPLLGGRTFTARAVDGGVEVSNLGQSPLIPWLAFETAISLLIEGGGEAIRGKAIGFRLGDPELPLDSIEGRVASAVYGMEEGDSVFRRITPIAKILIHSGVCENINGNMVLIQNN